MNPLGMTALSFFFFKMSEQIKSFPCWTTKKSHFIEWDSNNFNGFNPFHIQIPVSFPKIQPMFGFGISS